MATKVNTGTQAQVAGGSSLTINSPSATALNKLILEVSWVLSTGGAATPGAIAGWTKDLGPLSAANATTGAAGYAVYSKTAAGGVESPVFASPDGSGNLYANGIITEWSGMGAHDTADSSAIVTNNTGGASTGVTVPNTATLSASTGTAFSGIAILAGTGLTNAAIALAGWTADATDQNTSASVGTLLSDKALASNGAVGAAYTWTSDGSILSFQAAVVVYSDSGAGGGGTGTTQHTDTASSRNRPGRGPFSTGHFYVSGDMHAVTIPRAQTAGVTESVTAADAVSAQMAEANTLSESVSASDSVSQNISTTGSVTEAAAAADLVGNVSSMSQTASESVTPSDALTNLIGGLQSVSESVTAADSVINGSAASFTVSESVAASDAVSAVISALNTLTEAITAADAEAASLAAIAGVNEAVAAADSVSTGTSATGSLSESVSSTDAVASTLAAVSNINEAASASDTISTGSILTASASESVTAADASGQTLAAANSLAESVTASDSVSASRAAILALGEVVSAADSLSAALAAIAASSESVTAADLVTTANAFTASLTEAVVTADALVVAAGGVSILESVTTMDALAVLASLGASLTEVGVAADSYTFVLDSLVPILVGSLRYLVRRLRGRRYIVSNSTYLQFELLYTGEEQPLTFDFTQDLPTGVTLQGVPTIEITLLSGTDPTPTAIQNGAAGFDGSAKMVIVPAIGNVVGTYRIKVHCSTTQDDLAPTIVGELVVVS